MKSKYEYEGNPKDKKIAWLVPKYCAYDGISKLMMVRLQYMPVKERKKVTIITFEYDNTIIPYGYTIHIIVDKIMNVLKEDYVIDRTLLT